jgi:two-component system sensor histidine kinase UhpB
VLILEDNQDDVNLILYALRGLVFTHRVVNSQSSFMVALDSTFDVLLSDYNLPQYNALQALNEIKSRDLRLPLIVVTGFLQQTDMDTLINMGAHGFIIKDDLTDLPRMIQRVTDGH